GWHVVIDGEQVGPLADADVRAKIEHGEIKADTYTWKEGFADWVKLSAVPEFAGLVSGDEVAAAAAAGGGGELFTATPASTNGADRARRASSAGASLFGGGEAGDVFASPEAAPARGGDLFAASAAPSAEESRWPSSGAPSAGHDGGRVESLTGQRHENSVLFSLSNLQSLAMPNAAPKPVAGTSATPEGSGLIDIRAMAASTLGTAEKSTFNGGPGGGSSAPDDLPAFGSFSPAAPVLLPLPSSSGPPKWLYAAGVLMLAALIGIGFMAWKVLSAKPPVLVETVQAVPPPPAPAAPAKQAAPEATKPSTIADDKLPPREGSPEASNRGAEREHHHGKHEHEASGKGDKKGDKAEKGGGSATAVASAEPAEKKPPKGSLDDLLDGAVRHPGGGSGRPKVSDDDGKPAASAGPLAKSAVVAGMNSVKPKVAACYNEYKQQGMAMVNVVIGKNGKVSSATVTGKFAGTPTGACVEKAVKSATFPPSDGFTTPYPFQLR
ncbi:MAG TPA: GYF domain-containing protein, partial [Polyangia bacterium]|nr:GYF domain-containing protein [Polyangia bacterium]